MSAHLPESWRHELTLLRGELDALDTDIESARGSAAHGTGAPLSFKHEEEPKRARLDGEAIRLRDGAQVMIRPIEPEDAGEFRRGLKHLSAMTAYRRFREHITDVDQAELERLTRIDHVRHEALAAIGPDGSLIGVARYVCDPKDASQAEVTYVVADAWQRRGVGSVLLDRLAQRALAAGVDRFIATTLGTDYRARRILLRVADPVDARDHDGIIETTARLRAPGENDDGRATA